MTSKVPSIDPGNIRVILHMEGQPFADLHVAKLPEWFSKLDEFAGYIPTPPLVEGTGEGARSARTMFMRAFDTEEGYALATQIALWICLYAPPLIPGYGLTMDVLKSNAGIGTLNVYPENDFWTFQFTFGGPETQFQYGGRKDIPRDPKSMH